jgi:hyperosmotically inducible periplasmic protein
MMWNTRNIQIAAVCAALFQSRSIQMKSYKVLAASLLSALACLSVNVTQAQTADETTHVSKKVQRSANWKLEHSVRTALDKKKIDTSDIRVRAHSGAVALSGTVGDESQIALAGSIAQGVPGVSSVRNDVSMHQVGTQ